MIPSSKGITASNSPHISSTAPRNIPRVPDGQFHGSNEAEISHKNAVSNVPSVVHTGYSHNTSKPIYEPHYSHTDSSSRFSSVTYSNQTTENGSVLVTISPRGHDTPHVPVPAENTIPYTTSGFPVAELYSPISPPTTRCYSGSYSSSTGSAMVPNKRSYANPGPQTAATTSVHQGLHALPGPIGHASGWNAAMHGESDDSALSPQGTFPAVHLQCRRSAPPSTSHASPPAQPQPPYDPAASSPAPTHADSRGYAPPPDDAIARSQFVQRALSLQTPSSKQEPLDAYASVAQPQHPAYAETGACASLSPLPSGPRADAHARVLTQSAHPATRYDQRTTVLSPRRPEHARRPSTDITPRHHHPFSTSTPQRMPASPGDAIRREVVQSTGDMPQMFYSELVSPRNLLESADTQEGRDMGMQQAMAVASAQLGYTPGHGHRRVPSQGSLPSSVHSQLPPVPLSHGGSAAHTPVQSTAHSLHERGLSADLDARLTPRTPHTLSAQSPSSRVPPLGVPSPHLSATSSRRAGMASPLTRSPPLSASLRSPAQSGAEQPGSPGMRSSGGSSPKRRSVYDFDVPLLEPGEQEHLRQLARARAPGGEYMYGYKTPLQPRSLRTEDPLAIPRPATAAASSTTSAGVTAEEGLRPPSLLPNSRSNRSAYSPSVAASLSGESSHSGPPLGTRTHTPPVLSPHALPSSQSFSMGVSGNRSSPILSPRRLPTPTLVTGMDGKDAALYPTSAPVAAAISVPFPRPNSPTLAPTSATVVPQSASAAVGYAPAGYYGASTAAVGQAHPPYSRHDSMGSPRGPAQQPQPRPAQAPLPQQQSLFQQPQLYPPQHQQQHQHQHQQQQHQQAMPGVPEAHALRVGSSPRMSAPAPASVARDGTRSSTSSSSAVLRSPVRGSGSSAGSAGANLSGYLSPHHGVATQQYQSPQALCAASFSVPSASSASAASLVPSLVAQMAPSPAASLASQLAHSSARVGLASPLHTGQALLNPSAQSTTVQRQVVPTQHASTQPQQPLALQASQQQWLLQQQQHTHYQQQQQQLSTAVGQSRVPTAQPRPQGPTAHLIAHSAPQDVYAPVSAAVATPTPISAPAQPLPYATMSTFAPADTATQLPLSRATPTQPLVHSKSLQHALPQRRSHDSSTSPSLHPSLPPTTHLSDSPSFRPSLPSALPLPTIAIVDALAAEHGEFRSSMRLSITALQIDASEESRSSASGTNDLTGSTGSREITVIPPPPSRDPEPKLVDSLRRYVAVPVAPNNNPPPHAYGNARSLAGHLHPPAVGPGTGQPANPRRGSMVDMFPDDQSTLSASFSVSARASTMSARGSLQSHGKASMNSSYTTDRGSVITVTGTGTSAGTGVSSGAGAYGAPTTRNPGDETPHRARAATINPYLHSQSHVQPQLQVQPQPQQQTQASYSQQQLQHHVQPPAPHPPMQAQPSPLRPAPPSGPSPLTAAPAAPASIASSRSDQHVPPTTTLLLSPVASVASAASTPVFSPLHAQPQPSPNLRHRRMVSSTSLQPTSPTSPSGLSPIPSEPSPVVAADGVAAHPAVQVSASSSPSGPLGGTGPNTSPFLPLKGLAAGKPAAHVLVHTSTTPMHIPDDHHPHPTHTQHAQHRRIASTDSPSSLAPAPAPAPVSAAPRDSPVHAGFRMLNYRSGGAVGSVSYIDLDECSGDALPQHALQPHAQYKHQPHYTQPQYIQPHPPPGPALSTSSSSSLGARSPRFPPPSTRTPRKLAPVGSHSSLPQSPLATDAHAHPYPQRLPSQPSSQTSSPAQRPAPAPTSTPSPLLHSAASPLRAGVLRATSSGNASLGLPLDHPLPVLDIAHSQNSSLADAAQHANTFFDLHGHAFVMSPLAAHPHGRRGSGNSLRGTDRDSGSVASSSHLQDLDGAQYTPRMQRDDSQRSRSELDSSFTKQASVPDFARAAHPDYARNSRRGSLRSRQDILDAFEDGAIPRPHSVGTIPTPPLSAASSIAPSPLARGRTYSPTMSPAQSFSALAHVPAPPHTPLSYPDTHSAATGAGMLPTHLEESGESFPGDQRHVPSPHITVHTPRTPRPPTDPPTGVRTPRTPVRVGVAAASPDGSLRSPRALPVRQMAEDAVEGRALRSPRAARSTLARQGTMGNSMASPRAVEARAEIFRVCKEDDVVVELINTNAHNHNPTRGSAPTLVSASTSASVTPPMLLSALDASAQRWDCQWLDLYGAVDQAYVAGTEAVQVHAADWAFNAHVSTQQIMDAVRSRFRAFTEQRNALMAKYSDAFRAALGPNAHGFLDTHTLDQHIRRYFSKPRRTAQPPPHITHLACEHLALLYWDHGAPPAPPTPAPRRATIPVVTPKKANEMAIPAPALPVQKPLPPSTPLRSEQPRRPRPRAVEGNLGIMNVVSAATPRTQSRSLSHAQESPSRRPIPPAHPRDSVATPTPALVIAGAPTGVDTRSHRVDSVASHDGEEEDGAGEGSPSKSRERSGSDDASHDDFYFMYVMQEALK